MGQLVMFPPFQSGIFEIQQIVFAAGKRAAALFLGGGTIEIDQIVRARRKKTGENTRIKIGARCGIHIYELRPAKITLVFRADQSCDMARVPSHRQHHPNKPADTCWPKQ